MLLVWEQEWKTIENTVCYDMKMDDDVTATGKQWVKCCTLPLYVGEKSCMKWR